MPAKNRNKTFYEDGFYHVYNRGVEKRKIFIDKQDHVVFLSLLKKYLTPKPVVGDALAGNHRGPTPKGSDLVKILRPYESLHDEVNLLTFCLMPNHFHLLLQQKKIDSMTKLLRRVCTSYSGYFNKKYDRVGTLFQSIYKAIDIDNENYLLHLSRYIHLNPLELAADAEVGPLQRSDLLRNYEWSSYPEYIDVRKTEWLKTELILSYFKSEKAKDVSIKDFNSYQSFVEDQSLEDQSKVLTPELTFD